MDPGTQLGPYRIREPLGAGGMGEVYRASDGRLDRDVAIKVLPADFAADADRLARFEREAKMLASLNHANIAAIYGLEEADGTRFIAMELVEGETLDDLIQRRGRLGLDEALELALQIAEGLRAAHDHDVVHRDLKPANIQVTPEGAVKLLDFGLARPQQGAGSSSGGTSDQTQSPTMLQVTGAGMILGTAAYMSPEQAKGKSVDKRADIWAFGVVLYEMLVGDKLFAREDLTETLASVIRDEPDLDAVPPRARRLLEACLRKDPFKRLRDIGDVRELLGDEAVRERGPLPPTPPSKAPWAVAAAAVVIALAMASVVIPGWLRGSTEGAPRRFSVLWPTEASALDANATAVFTVSPDGRDLVILDNDRLWVRRAEALEARQIEDTLGAYYPFWSPDGESVAFFREGRVRSVTLATDVMRDLTASVDMRGGAWGRNGTILFGEGIGGIHRVSEMGGAAEVITSPPDDGNSSHRYPQFLPGEDTFLYFNLSRGETQGTYLADFSGSEPQLILEHGTVARFLPREPGATDGHLLFRDETTLMARPFDAATATLSGDAFPVAEGVGHAGNTGFSAFSASPGMLAFSAMARPQRDLAWLSRSGELIAQVAPPSPFGAMDVSPDGTLAAVDRVVDQSDNSSEVLRYDLGSMRSTPFASGEPGWSNPVWSNGGDRIAYGTYGLSGLDAYEVRFRPMDMSSDDTEVDRHPLNALVWDWGPDDESILIGRNFGLGAMVLRSLVSEAEEVVVPGDGTYIQGRFSPDGRWLAYTSIGGTRPEVFVKPYPGATAGQQISLDGGEMPRWRDDGRELYYVAPDGTLMALSLQVASGSSGQTLRPGPPTALFSGLRVSAPNSTPQFASYAPVDGGERFLVMRSFAEPKNPITVIVDWQAGLE
jgi:Tol biopolymer transport system component/predicted Ser/Thr protein kinase